MKPWILLILIVVLLWAMPFQSYDTERLLPILCIQAQRERGGIRILSEGGEGFGISWAEAVENLRENASGEVFFHTAEQAVFSDMELAVEAAGSGDLRPGAEVFFRCGMEDPRILYPFYRQHRSDLKIADLMEKEVQPG